MPPRASLTGSFSVTDTANEVVCPLKNPDGSSCRKRCFGEKRYRSMQEHIRRAHPEHYIPKLPATEESFQLMINSPPSERPLYPTTGPDQRPPAPRPTSHHIPHDDYPRRPPNVFRRTSLLPAASAAAALAQLHDSRPGDEWESDQEPFSDSESKTQQHNNFFAQPDTDAVLTEPFPSSRMSPPHLSALLPPLARTPSGRASSMQPFSRAKPARPRKSSITESARRPKHERNRSKEFKKWLGHDRKAFSAEPQSLSSVSGSRWEDLLDAAASATEEDSRDLTPIPQSPHRSPVATFSQPNSAQYQPYAASPLQNTLKMVSPEPSASPPFRDESNALPSVEPVYDEPARSFHQQQSSIESTASSNNRPYHHAQHSSGSNFHIPSSGLSTSPKERPPTAHSHSQSLTGPSPLPNNTTNNYHHPFSTNINALSNTQTRPAVSASMNQPQPPHAMNPTMPSPTQHHHQQAPPPPQVQHYCAACNRITALTTSYACTECICGICRDCVDVLVGMAERGARCPRCGTVGGKFKPFMLDLR